MDYRDPNRNYDCIPGIKFKEEQIDAIDFALCRFNCIIGLKPGLGKTLVSLRVAYEILRRNQKTICFILCPKEANTAFKKEFRKRVRLPYSIMTTEEQSFNSKGRFMIFNYSNLDYLEEYLNKCRVNGYRVFLIADEIHLMQSPDSNMSTRLRRMRPYFSCVIGLTGTPILNALEGVWRIVDFVCPGFLGKYNEFRYRYIKYNKRTVRVNGKARVIEEIQGYRYLDELRKRLEEIIITRGITYNVEFIYKTCCLTEKERENYEIAAKGVFESEDEKHIPARLHDLQRIADGSHHLMEEGVTYSKCRLLVNTLREIINRREGVLVYTEYEDTYKTLGDVVKKYKSMIGYKNLYFITGKISYKKRVEVEQYLKSGDIVILTKAGCKSINLQAVNNVVVYDCPFAIGDLIQLIGRVTRVDTKWNKQNVYFLEVEQTIDTYKRLLIQSHATMIQEVFGKDSNLPYFGDMENDVVSKYRTYLKNKLLWCRIK